MSWASVSRHAVRLHLGRLPQAMSFLVGTPESTAAAMSFCVHCLATHPAAQAALLQARRPTQLTPAHWEAGPSV